MTALKLCVKTMIASLFYNPTFESTVGTSALLASLGCGAVLVAWAYVARKQDRKKPALFWYLSATAIGLFVFGIVCGLFTPSPSL